MGDFSFNSSGPTRSSTFQKLVSGKIDSADSPGQSSGVKSGEGRIFNEVGAAPGAENGQVDEAKGRLVGLEAAVTNITESRASIQGLGSNYPEVEGANSDASRVSVRDVNAASELADTLYSRITGNEGLANNAQVVRLSPENVQRVLS